MATEHLVLWLQLKVPLRDVHPAVWWRVRLPDCLSISDRRKVIRLLMGRDDPHLFDFRIRGRRCGGARQVDQIVGDAATAVPLSWFGFRRGIGGPLDATHEN